MAHSDNIISSIKLPDGVTYELHDEQAIHSVEELGLSAAMVFKGTKATVDDLPTSGNKTGDVWTVTEDACEYVWTDSSAWELLGPTRDSASASHTHTVTVTGTNEASSVTGSVTVPKVGSTQKYLTATAGTPGKSTTTASAITGFGTHTTAAAITALNTTTVKNPTVSDVSIPNVTGNDSVTASKVGVTAGSAAAWGASVTNGVLSFSWTTNTPTAVTASDVTASKVTLGTAIGASKVTTSDVTVATGSKTTANAITGLGTATTETVLTGVTLSAPAITLTEADATSTGAVPVVSAVSVGTETATVSGTAAAQTWTQKTGVTGVPQ